MALYNGFHRRPYSSTARRCFWSTSKEWHFTDQFLPLRDGPLKLPNRLRRHEGSKAERLVARYLSGYGLQTLMLNYHCRQGEIDLIARDGNSLVFVEVRLRQSDTYGTPVETVTLQKQTRIIRCARYFLMKNPQCNDIPCRFDIVGVSPASNGRGYNYQWLKDAFRYSE